MKTLSQIRGEVAEQYGFIGWYRIITVDMMNDVAKSYAHEVAQQALLNASNEVEEHQYDIELPEADTNLLCSIISDSKNIPI